MNWLNKLDSVLESVLPRDGNDANDEYGTADQDSIDADEYYRNHEMNAFPYTYSNSNNNGIDNMSMDIGGDRDGNCDERDLVLPASTSTLGSVPMNADSETFTRTYAHRYDDDDDNHASKVIQSNNQSYTTERDALLHYHRPPPPPPIPKRNGLPGMIRPILREHSDDSSFETESFDDTTSMNTLSASAAPIVPMDHLDSTNTKQNQFRDQEEERGGKNHRTNTNINLNMPTNNANWNNANRRKPHMEGNGGLGEPHKYNYNPKDDDDDDDYDDSNIHISPAQRPREIQTLPISQNFRMSPLFTPPPILQSLPLTATTATPNIDMSVEDDSSISRKINTNRHATNKLNAKYATANTKISRPPLHAFPSPIDKDLPSSPPSPPSSPSTLSAPDPPPPPPPAHPTTIDTPLKEKLAIPPRLLPGGQAQVHIPPPPPPPPLINVSSWRDEDPNTSSQPLIVPDLDQDYNVKNDAENEFTLRGGLQFAPSQPPPSSSSSSSSQIRPWNDDNEWIHKNRSLEHEFVEAVDATTPKTSLVTGIVATKEDLERNDLHLDEDSDVDEDDAVVENDHYAPALNGASTAMGTDDTDTEVVALGLYSSGLKEDDPLLSTTLTLTQAVETASSYLPTNMFGGLVPSMKSEVDVSNKETTQVQPVAANEQQQHIGENEDVEDDEQDLRGSNSTPKDSLTHDYNALEGMQATFGDFFPTGTLEDDKSASSTQSEREDYEVHLQNSWEDDGLSPFESWMNCHGVVYVRLLRVQHLPCSKDAALQATFSLPPWKGRVRSEKAKTYQGPSKSGICARWDKNLVKGGSKDEGDDDENEIPCVSMVHTYNDSQSPVPVISIVLKDSALMFEREVCSVLLSCEPLMKRPGIFRRQWCQATQGDKNPSGSVGKSGGAAESSLPLLLVEACFEPTEFGDDKRISSYGYKVIGEVNSTDNEGQGTRERFGTHDTNDSFSKVIRRGLKSKPHMFLNYASFRPTYCALCSSMFMWKMNGLHCEICQLDCCHDCRLRIDVEMPCGSDKAIDAVKKLAQSKLTFSKIYEAVAPKKEIEKMPPSTDFAPLNRGDLGGSKGWSQGVGTFTLRIKKACIFKHNFSPETSLGTVLEASDRRLRSGDYYARVSWTDGDETKRTKTVFQSATPRFDSDDIVITSMHYGTEFKIEVIDAVTDKVVGTKLLTTQGLLQWQRDNIGWGLSLSSIYDPLPLRLSKSSVHLELRSGVKSGFGLDFYNTSKINEISRAGEIGGWVEVDVTFQENPDLYSNSHPRPYPPRPAEDFNVELIQLHIARITSLVGDLNKLLDSYFYLVSWKNPALTSLSMIIFVFTCLRFNTEYIGSLPFIFMIGFMIHSGRIRRTSGGFKVRLVKKETEEKLKEMRGTSVKYRTHRPLGDLEILITKGRNLVSHHGIPGSLVSSIIWDPLKFASEDDKKSLVECDPSLNGLHQIGETEGSVVTASPEWKLVNGSNDLERMKQLLPSKNFLSRTQSNDNLRSGETTLKQENGLHFPILQPIAPIARNHIDHEHDPEGDDDDTIELENVQLLPWKASKGAIIIQVRFADVLNKLPIFDQILGDVVIPISRIAENMAIEGWFEVLEKGTLRTSELPNIDDSTHISDPKSDEEETTPKIESDTKPCIFLKIKLNDSMNRLISDIDKETSIVVAEHLIRTARKRNEGPGFIGTSISTFNTMTGVRGNLQYLQNQLGDVLDMIEIVLNTFNFTCPDKSGMILVLFCLLWFILSLIPTRYVILMGGLGQYISTFMAAFQKEAMSVGEEKKVPPMIKDEYDPYTTRIQNFFFGIPTNEDLRRYYFWDAIQVGEREREIVANKKRATRLAKLWKAQWFGKLELKVRNESGNRWNWKHIFCIIQGHRFIWWDSEKDFDEGENPSGQVYFAGHSGLAGLSPLELRELKKTEVPLVTNIFGRGATSRGEQTKISLLSPDSGTKDGFENAVLNATLEKHD